VSWLPLAFLRMFASVHQLFESLMPPGDAEYAFNGKEQDLLRAAQKNGDLGPLQNHKENCASALVHIPEEDPKRIRGQARIAALEEAIQSLLASAVCISLLGAFSMKHRHRRVSCTNEAF
jgi:hypothetical protein